MPRILVMGRHFLVAGIAMLAASTAVIAKPDKQEGATGHGAVGCPPGLQKKNAPCMPPGRYKKLFEIGERVPTGYKGLMPYGALPYGLRMGYGGTLDRQARYVFSAKPIVVAGKSLTPARNTGKLSPNRGVVVLREAAR